MPFWSRKPKVVCSVRNGWAVVDVTTDISLSTNLSFLLALVRRQLRRGGTAIAVRFTRKSFLDSKALAFLVRSWEAIRDAGGTLAVVAPNEQMVTMVQMLNLRGEIRFHESLETLPPVDGAAEAR